MKKLLLFTLIFFKISFSQNLGNNSFKNFVKPEANSSQESKKI